MKKLILGIALLGIISCQDDGIDCKAKELDIYQDYAEKIEVAENSNDAELVRLLTLERDNLIDDLDCD